MNRKIYVQCATGGRATLAAKQLKDIGFTNVTAVVMELQPGRREDIRSSRTGPNKCIVISEPASPARV